MPIVPNVMIAVFTHDRFDLLRCCVLSLLRILPAWAWLVAYVDGPADARIAPWLGERMPAHVEARCYGIGWQRRRAVSHFLAGDASALLMSDGDMLVDDGAVAQMCGALDAAWATKYEIGLLAGGNCWPVKHTRHVNGRLYAHEQGGENFCLMPRKALETLGNRVEARRRGEMGRLKRALSQAGFPRATLLRPQIPVQHLGAFQPGLSAALPHNRLIWWAGTESNIINPMPGICDLEAIARSPVDAIRQLADVLEGHEITE